MRIFEHNKLTEYLDWQDAVNVRLGVMEHEIKALRKKIDHMDVVITNIKKDVEIAIEKCLTTKNIADGLP